MDKYKIRILLGLLLAGISLTVQGQMVKSIYNQLKPGSRKDTLVKLGEGKNEYIPLTIIKGSTTGPTFTIMAGVHGYEYPPIIAVQQIIADINANQLSGTLLILPVSNVASFYGRSPFVNPIDHINLNTAFPGDASGTITNRIANFISTEIIPNTDILLDIHGGDASEDLLPFICYYNHKGEMQKTHQAKQLCEASGMEYVVEYPYTLKKDEPAKYAFKQAVQYGITALSIEAGKLGTVQETNVKLIRDAVYNILGFAGLYHARTNQKPAGKKYLKNQAYIRVPQTGIFYTTIKSGDTISTGQNIGYITDEFGKVKQQITSQVSGIVLYKIGTPPVNEGETLFCIGN